MKADSKVKEQSSHNRATAIGGNAPSFNNCIRLVIRLSKIEQSQSKSKLYSIKHSKSVETYTYMVDIWTTHSCN